MSQSSGVRGVAALKGHAQSSFLAWTIRCKRVDARVFNLSFMRLTTRLLAWMTATFNEGAVDTRHSSQVETMERASPFGFTLSDARMLEQNVDLLATVSNGFTEPGFLPASLRGASPVRHHTDSRTCRLASRNRRLFAHSL